MNYRFLRAAQAEYLDKVAFYENRAPGLGADYLADFETVMARIGANPDIYPCIGNTDIRKAGLKHFLFHVIYRVDPAYVVILAIAHQGRRPAH